MTDELRSKNKPPRIFFKFGRDYMHCDRGRYLFTVAWGRFDAEEGVVPYRHYFEINIRLPEINFYAR